MIWILNQEFLPLFVWLSPLCVACSRILSCVRPYPLVDFGVFRSSRNIQPAPTDASDPRSCSDCSRALLLVDEWSNARRRGSTAREYLIWKLIDCDFDKVKVTLFPSSSRVHRSSDVNKCSRCTNSREREPNEFNRIRRTKIFIFSVFYLGTPL